MALLDRIQVDLVAAMRAKDEARLGTIRMIKTALKKHEIDSMKPLDEPTELQLLNTLVKQRRESADMFRKGGRPDLADKEDAELKQIEAYMPSAPTDDEVDDAITAAITETGATSAKQMGMVMKAAQAKLAGKRVDGKALSEKVKAKLI
jgi:uncharacterized protein